jgi:hypothetical protein
LFHLGSPAHVALLFNLKQTTVSSDIHHCVSSVIEVQYGGVFVLIKIDY